MLFPTIDFAIFFGVVFLGHWLLNPFPRRWKLFMIAASYVFYAWWDWRLVWLLAAATIIAQAGAQAVARATSDRRRRWAMGIAVAALLGLLGWFKYYGFFSLNLTNTLRGLGLRSALPLVQVTLPVGISFYTFMAVSYVVDVYRGVLAPAGWLDTFVYLSFFPHLVAGAHRSGRGAAPSAPAAPGSAPGRRRPGRLPDLVGPVQEGRAVELPRFGHRGSGVRKPARAYLVGDSDRHLRLRRPDLR